MRQPTWGHAYWTCWSIAAFLTFIGPEIYALITNWHNTLSAAVWDLESFRTGQPMYQWSFGHFAFVGLLFILFAWLSGHFAFGWWR